MRKDRIHNEIPQGYYTKRLSNGYNATCYLTDFNMVYKEYPYEYEYLRELEYLSHYKSDFVAFPEEFIFLNKDGKPSLRGYLMKYIEGITLDQIDEATKIRDLVNALSQFEREMLRLTMEGVMFTDLNYKNLIYTPDSLIKAVDTDLYDVTYDDDFKRMYRENIKELAASIISQFVHAREFQNSRMGDLVRNCGAYGIIKSSDLIEGLTEEAKKETKEEIETIGEFKRTLQMLKK